MLNLRDICHKKRAPPISPISVFTGQSWFPPGTLSQDFRLWNEAGLICLTDITKGGSMLPKTVLEARAAVYYRVPWPQYFQLRDLVSCPNVASNLKIKLTGSENLLSALMVVNKGLISCIYNMLPEADNSKLPTYTTPWHKYLSIDLTSQQWMKIWKSPALKSNLITFCSQAFKLMA